MNKPVTKLGEELLAELQKYHIDGDEDRWSKGIDHHPMSEIIVRRLSEIDYMFFDYAMEWQVGGDGDNGETLMYQLDILFDLWDKLYRGDPWMMRGDRDEQKNCGQ